MRKGVILFLLSFFMLQFSCAEARTGLSDKAAYNVKNSVIDPNEWDFGQVKQGTISKHDFILKNETNDILEINNIHTSSSSSWAVWP